MCSWFIILDIFFLLQMATCSYHQGEKGGPFLMQKQRGENKAQQEGMRGGRDIGWEYENIF
jgi:hypothetical protein